MIRGHITVTFTFHITTIKIIEPVFVFRWDDVQISILKLLSNETSLKSLDLPFKQDTESVNLATMMVDVNIKSYLAHKYHLRLDLCGSSKKANDKNQT